MNIILQDQIDDAPIRFTTPIPPLRNQAILATPAVSVITTPYSSQCFLTMNSPVLSSELTALETKMYGKMMVITFYFKDELQSLKKILLCINKQFYRYRSISLFFMYIVFVGKPIFIMILNWMMDILWQIFFFFIYSFFYLR